MQDVRLGTTGLRVSAIGLGTWSYGSDWGAVDVVAATKGGLRLDGAHLVCGGTNHLTL